MIRESDGNPLQREEDEAVRELQRRVDTVCARVTEQRTPRAQLEAWMAEVRLFAALRFPDQLDRFDRIYESRFDRLLSQFPPPD